MRALGIAKCVTIVGDPDQSSKSTRLHLGGVSTHISVYGWRAAEVKNIAKMQKRWCSSVEHIQTPYPFADFPGTEQIFLEQNYRSTSSILKCSLAIVSQGLFTLALL